MSFRTRLLGTDEVEVERITCRLGLTQSPAVSQTYFEILFQVPILNVLRNQDK
jgi:hypothetical protein